MIPEEEIQELKKQVENLSSAFVSLSSAAIKQIDQNSRIDALKAILKSLISEESRPQFEKIFKEVYDLLKERHLIDLENSDPAFAALIDDRPVEDGSIPPEFPER